jgi:hypothetical protein
MHSCKSPQFTGSGRILEPHRHPELPDVLIVLGAGSGNGQRLTLGHFAAMRWRVPDLPTAHQPADDTDNEDHEHGQDDDEEAEPGEAERLAVQRSAEVLVGGEGLARGPAEVGRFPQTTRIQPVYRHSTPRFTHPDDEAAAHGDRRRPGTARLVNTTVVPLSSPVT